MGRSARSVAGRSLEVSRIWLDGRLVDATAPHLSVYDRGFQLGDGIFETARARRGVVIELDDHLERLRQSATALAIRLPVDDAAMVAGIDALLEAEGLAGSGLDGQPLGDAALRITVSRGPLGRRGLLPPGFDEVPATIAIQVWPYAPPPAEVVARGIRAISSAVRRDPHSPLAGIKSTSRADYVYAKLEAARAGVDDALFLTTDGAISEGTTANVWLVAGRTLVTPPLGAAVLPGTTRTWLLANTPELGLEPQESDISPDRLIAADEAFLSSSVAGIVPLTAFDGRTVGNGRPGPWTANLRAAREAAIDAQGRAGR
ncbi:MAG: branched-chain amino acid aminotransferase [Chloroflexota bacterium]|nr:branched-chain amino acid aminotransferase [Chloroflexota bacterium]